ncbi:MAG: MFS transporter, partial [Acidimicrobiia bacterium]|nr:MFS transporter [Acidimicrobiia bacterium]
GQESGLGAPHILALFAVALVAGAAFIRRMLTVDQPMVDLRLFRSPLLTVSVVSGFLTFVAVSALFLLLPFFLEGVLGFGIALVGVLLGASPLVLGIVAPISGWLSDRIGVRVLTLIGLLMMSGVYFGFRTVSTDMSIPHYLALAIPFGIGIGVFQSPNNSAIMGSVPKAFTGLAAGLLSITRILGQITGVAVIGSIWASRVAARSEFPLPGGDATAALPVAQVGGLKDVFTILASLLLVAAIVGAWGLTKERQEKALV